MVAHTRCASDPLRSHRNTHTHTLRVRYAEAFRIFQQIFFITHFGVDAVVVVTVFAFTCRRVCETGDNTHSKKNMLSEHNNSVGKRTAV